jgi:phage terminase large subunit
MVAYNPSPKQSLFHQSQHPVTVLLCGIGFGKSYAAVHEAFFKALTFGKGSEGLMVAPTYKLLTQGLMETWKKVVPSNCYRMTAGDRMELFNGSIIWWRTSSEPERLRGMNLSWAVFDEASAEPTDEAYKEIRNRLRIGQNPQLFITTTPNGLNWLSKVTGLGPHSNGFQGTNDQWWNSDILVIKATTMDNPLYPRDSVYIKNLLDRPDASPEWIQQNVFAEYTSKQGLVFPQFKASQHVIKQLPRNIKRYIAGHDFGFSDFGALLVLAETVDKKLIAVHEEYHRGLTSDEYGWYQLIEEIKEKYSPEFVVCDSASPERIAAMRKYFKHRPVFIESTKDTIGSIRRVQKLLNADKFLVHESCKNLITEIQNWSWKQDKRGNSLEIPESGNDHLQDCLRYSVMELSAQFFQG